MTLLAMAHIHIWQNLSNKIQILIDAHINRIEIKIKHTHTHRIYGVAYTHGDVAMDEHNSYTLEVNRNSNTQ